MLDRWSLQLIKPTLSAAAETLHRLHVRADQVTVTGFALGLLAATSIAMEHYSLGLILLLCNRIADGVDGELARLAGSTDRGAYLDIVLDFIFYAAIVFAFALANPAANALAAAALLFGFMGTGSSFLAFAIMAERRQLNSMRYPGKGFYYLNGITEGTETIAFFVLMCIWPAAFSILAWIFFALCLMTTVTRVIGGAYTLRPETADTES